MKGNWESLNKTNLTITTTYITKFIFKGLKVNTNKSNLWVN